MRTIWKFPLSTDRSTVILMPICAEILTLQMQNDVPTLWALVDSKAPRESRTFHIFGTGHELPTTPLRYIGTFQPNDGGSQLVFHVFESAS